MVNKIRTEAVYRCVVWILKQYLRVMDHESLQTSPVLTTILLSTERHTRQLRLLQVVSNLLRKEFLRCRNSDNQKKILTCVFYLYFVMNEFGLEATKEKQFGEIFLYFRRFCASLLWKYIGFSKSCLCICRCFSELFFTILKKKHLEHNGNID